MYHYSQMIGEDWGDNVDINDMINLFEPFVSFFIETFTFSGVSPSGISTNPQFNRSFHIQTLLGENDRIPMEEKTLEWEQTIIL